MKAYFCKVDWSVTITAENEEEAKRQAWEIFYDTLNPEMIVEED